MGFKKKNETVLVLLLMAMVSLPLLFSNAQSFWIDEGVTIAVATKSSFLEMLRDIWQRQSSEPQMLGYFPLIHFWSKAFGDTEIISRFSNLPWMLMFAVFWVKLGTAFTHNKSVLAAFTMSGAILPFSVYYSIEYRPYAASIAVGAFLTYTYLMSDNGGDKFKQLFGFAACLAVYLHMMGLFILVTFVLSECLLYRGDFRRILEKWRPVLIWCVPVVSVFGIYYMATILRGAGGVRIQPSLLNIGAIFYEFLGFGGLGPDRESLKTTGLIQKFLYFIPYFAPLILGLSYLSLSSIKIALQERELDVGRERNLNLSMMTNCMIIPFIGILMMFACAVIVKWNIVGRHCSFWFPAFAAPLSMYVCHLLIVGKTNTIRVAAAAILAAWTLSSGRLIFDPRYFRDDYRGVAEFLKTRNLENTIVLLSGDGDTHDYYLSKNLASSQRDRIHVVNNLEIDALNQLISSRRSDEIFLITHKPRYYDQNQAMETWISSHPQLELVQKLKNFNIWYTRMN